MGYEELVEARAQRAEKDAAKAAEGKEKRGPKRKSDTPEADTPDRSEPKAKRKRVNKLSDSERPGSVSVAKMY